MSKELVYEKIKKVLNELNITHDEIEHPEVKTTEDSKRYRAENGWESGFGSKNLVFHAKGKFYVVVTTAEKELKARIFKKEFGTKDIRFAYAEEVAAATGCEPGAIPPFAHINEEIPIYFDKEIFSKEFFMFNPAIHTKSIRLKSESMKEIYKKLHKNASVFNVTEEGIEIEKII